MRRPTSVTNAYCSMDERAILGEIAQYLQTSLCLCNTDPGAVKHGNSGRIISAVLQLFETFQQHGRGLHLACISNYSAHGCGSFLKATGKARISGR